MFLRLFVELFVLRHLPIHESEDPTENGRHKGLYSYLEDSRTIKRYMYDYLFKVLRLLFIFCLFQHYDSQVVLLGDTGVGKTCVDITMQS